MVIIPEFYADSESVEKLQEIIQRKLSTNNTFLSFRPLNFFSEFFAIFFLMDSKSASNFPFFDINAAFFRTKF